MAEDWSADVKKYVSNPDAKVIAGIVRYCGIALQKRDSSLVHTGKFPEKETCAHEPRRGTRCSDQGRL